MGRPHFCYVITGPTGAYVGKTSRDPILRWREHRRDYGKREGPLYRAIRKYGVESFSFEVVLTAATEADAYACEMLLVKQFKNEGARLYNLTEGGVGISVGMKLSQETRRKMSEYRRGRPMPDGFGEKIRAGITRWWANREPSEAQKRGHRKGKKLTPEQCQQLSDRVTQTWKDPSRREKQAAKARERHANGTFGIRRSGEANPTVKFSSAIISEIRRLHAEGVTRRQLRERFSVSQTQIARIVRGESRRNG